MKRGFLNDARPRPRPAEEPSSAPSAMQTDSATGSAAGGAAAAEGPAAAHPAADLELPWPPGLAWGRERFVEEMIKQFTRDFDPNELSIARPPRTGQPLVLQLKMRSKPAAAETEADLWDQPWRADFTVRGRVALVTSALRLGAVSVARVQIPPGICAALRQATAAAGGAEEEWVAVLHFEKDMRRHRLVALAPAADAAAAPFLDAARIRGLPAQLARSAKDHANRSSRMVFRLRIRLMRVEPPIHRTVEILGGTRMLVVHSILNEAMGWYDSHLHQFYAKGASTVSVMFGDDGAERGDATEEKLCLCNLGLEAGDRFWYEYDTGDHWQHEIEVESVHEPEAGVTYPRCIGGQRACPPEDVGGVRGYAEFIAAASDPRASGYDREKAEWAASQVAQTITNRGAMAGGAWRADHFDLAAVNAALPRAVARGMRFQAGIYDGGA